MADTTSKSAQSVVIRPPKFLTAVFEIEGIAPYCHNKFSQKARTEIRDKQAAGSTAAKGKKREPKNFKALCDGAIRRSRQGWAGIPANAFRNAMIW